MTIVDIFLGVGLILFGCGFLTVWAVLCGSMGEGIMDPAWSTADDAAYVKFIKVAIGVVILLALAIFCIGSGVYIFIGP